MLKHQDLQMFGLKLDKLISDFQPLEVVARCTETQLQECENLNCLIKQDKD